MSFLVDTNILLRGAQPHHPMHTLAEDAVAVLRQQDERLCLVPQNLFEFWVAATRPLGENGLGLTIVEARAELLRLKAIWPILDDTPNILLEWERLVLQYDVSGRKAHDARLVAAMVVHGVQTLLTFDFGDFRRYQEITALGPADVLAAPAP